jgi:beta-galactosidase beta subunit
LIGSARAVLTLLDDNHARSPTETAGEAHRYSDISLILAGTDAGMDASATARGNHNSKIAENGGGVTGLLL